ncbi:MAG: hypothetical protein KGP29_02010 [Proteobacteria bacterium]|nr:hypothetical protein [Pseudomonadota bacterium]
MKKSSLLFFILLFFAQKSLAAENNLQMVNSVSDLGGRAFGNKTEKQVVNSFVEKPLSNKMSVGAITQVSRVDSKSVNYRDAYAINSIEFFNRYKIFSYEKLGVIIHNAFKLPGVYRENKYLGLMQQQPDYELRFLFAYNMSDRLINTVTRNETPYFARAEIAYRRRFSNPFDEARFAFWGGFKMNQDFSFLFQDNVTWNLVGRADVSNNSNSNLGTFNFAKDANNMATFSLMYHVSKDTALQFGYVKRLSGNAPFYDARGILVGLWNSF